MIDTKGPEISIAAAGRRAAAELSKATEALRNATVLSSTQTEALNRAIEALRYSRMNVYEKSVYRREQKRQAAIRSCKRYPPSHKNETLVNFQQGWREAMAGDTYPISELWDAVESEGGSE